jgi:hypothetical protein
MTSTSRAADASFVRTQLIACLAQDTMESPDLMPQLLAEFEALAAAEAVSMGPV